MYFPTHKLFAAGVELLLNSVAAVLLLMHDLPFVRLEAHESPASLWEPAGNRGNKLSPRIVALVSFGNYHEAVPSFSKKLQNIVLFLVDVMRLGLRISKT